MEKATTDRYSRGLSIGAINYSRSINRDIQACVDGVYANYNSGAKALNTIANTDVNSAINSQNDLVEKFHDDVTKCFNKGREGSRVDRFLHYGFGIE